MQFLQDQNGAKAVGLIDWNKVNELRDDVGHEDFDEVVELFLEEVEEMLAHLGAPGRSAEADMHFLKGAALNLGFSNFSDLCRDGEHAAAKDPDADINFEAVKDSYAVSKKLFLSDLMANIAS